MRSHWTALVQAEVQWAVHILSSQLWDQQNQQCLTYPVCSIRMSQSPQEAQSSLQKCNCLLVSMETVFFWQNKSAAISIAVAVRNTSATRIPPLPCHLSSASANFSAAADGNGHNHLRLIYLGHACCDKRAIFCGSQPPWIQRRTRWMQAHQALKSVWYLEQLMTGGARSPGEAARRQLFRAQEVHVDGITSAHQPNVSVCVFVPACQFCFPARACCFHFPLILEFRRTQVLLGF